MRAFFLLIEHLVVIRHLFRCCLATFLFCFKNFDQIALKNSQLISEGVKKFLTFFENLSQLISEGENFFADSIKNSAVNKWGQFFLKGT